LQVPAVFGAQALGLWKLYADDTSTHGRSFNGYMREFRIWEGQRSSEEIKQSYKLTLRNYPTKTFPNLYSVIALSSADEADLRGTYVENFGATIQKGSYPMQKGNVPWQVCCKDGDCPVKGRQGVCTAAVDGFSCPTTTVTTTTSSTATTTTNTFLAKMAQSLQGIEALALEEELARAEGIVSDLAERVAVEESKSAGLQTKLDMMSAQYTTVAAQLALLLDKLTPTSDGADPTPADGWTGCSAASDDEGGCAPNLVANRDGLAMFGCCGSIVLHDSDCTVKPCETQRELTELKQKLGLA
jgi:hypothetical protein